MTDHYYREEWIDDGCFVQTWVWYEVAKWTKWTSQSTDKTYDQVKEKVKAAIKREEFCPPCPPPAVDFFWEQANLPRLRWYAMTRSEADAFYIYRNAQLRIAGMEIEGINEVIYWGKMLQEIPWDVDVLHEDCDTLKEKGIVLLLLRHESFPVASSDNPSNKHFWLFNKSCEEWEYTGPDPTISKAAKEVQAMIAEAEKAQNRARHAEWKKKRDEETERLRQEAMKNGPLHERGSLDYFRTGY